MQKILVELYKLSARLREFESRLFLKKESLRATLQKNGKNRDSCDSDSRSRHNLTCMLYKEDISAKKVINFLLHLDVRQLYKSCPPLHSDRQPNKDQRNRPPLQNCTDYSCLARASYWSDLRHLELLSCHSLADCHHMDTGFVCSRDVVKEEDGMSC